MDRLNCGVFGTVTNGYNASWWPLRMVHSCWTFRGRARMCTCSNGTPLILILFTSQTVQRLATVTLRDSIAAELKLLFHTLQLLRRFFFRRRLISHYLSPPCSFSTALYPSGAHASLPSLTVFVRLVWPAHLKRTMVSYGRAELGQSSGSRARAQLATVLLDFHPA